MRTIVVKFGGTSLADVQQIRKTREIILSDPDRKYIVVSAPGKRFPQDSKITDLLLRCYEAAAKNEDYEQDLQIVQERFRETAEGLDLDFRIDEEISPLRVYLAETAGAGEDKKSDPYWLKTRKSYIISRGEYLNARLMAVYLDYTFVDPEWCVCFEENGKLNLPMTLRTLGASLRPLKNAVIAGFYGADMKGTIHTFSRGGSDVTGSLAAAAVHADLYENWTDVSGLLAADPRIVDSPKSVRYVSYRELRTLSYMGASVLHEDTVFPVRIRDIPVNIRNTNEPDNPGTIIREHFDDELEEETERFITGIAGKRNFSIISIYKSRMGEEKLGLLRQVLEVFAQYEIPVEQIPSGVDSFSVVFPSGSIGSRKHELMQELSEFEGIDNCTLTEGVSLIAIVGRQMAYRIGISGKIFKTLGENKINIRTIEQCADEINLMVGVYDEDFDRAIRVLYESFAK